MLYNLENECRAPPYREQRSVNGHDIEFEIDSGAGMGVQNESTRKKMARGALHHTRIILHTYTRDGVGLLGKMYAQVS